MKKLILHVGTHKTGTTAIQLFASQKPDLLHRLGMHYPANGKPVVPALSWGHHLVAWSFSGDLHDKSYWPDNDPAPQRVMAALLEEIESRTEPTILLSSEELCRLQRKDLGPMAEMFKGFEVVPVIYFRRFDEYLQATYATSALFFGERRTVVDYIGKVEKLVDYNRIVADWRDVFGPSVVVRPFHRRTLKDASIIADMFSYLGYSIRSEYLNAYADVNASPPWNVVECARLMNRLGIKLETMLEIWRLSRKIYRGSVPYDMIPPEYRLRLIERTIGFFEREFGDWHDDELWRHLRGADLASSTTEWKGRRRRAYSFVLQTLADVAAAMSSARGRSAASVASRPATNS